MSGKFRCGLVALAGRPNVGKSTLLNRVLGQKISITSRRPQTTRHRVLGIRSRRSSQIVYIDLPGIHAYGGRAMNRHMNRAASNALQEVDLVVFVIEGLRWLEDDELVLGKLQRLQCPVILAVNKIDRIADRRTLLPWMKALSDKHDFSEIVPVSAVRGENIDALEDCIEKLLPVSPPMFPDDQVTDRSERFLVAELIREKLFRRLARELPYGLTVEIESYRETQEMTHIHALIWVEKQSQKSIVIGRQGQLLREVGRQARQDIEAMLGTRVNLKLWVKVKEGWADDERALHSLGYTDR